MHETSLGGYAMIHMEKGLFQDVDVKIQVRPYLDFDVDVLKHAFFPWIITYALYLFLKATLWNLNRRYLCFL